MRSFIARCDRNHIGPEELRGVVLLQELTTMRTRESGAAFHAQQVCLSALSELEIHRAAGEYLGDVDVGVLVDLDGRGSGAVLGV